MGMMHLVLPLLLWINFNLCTAYDNTNADVTNKLEFPTTAQKNNIDPQNTIALNADNPHEFPFNPQSVMVFFTSFNGQPTTPRRDSSHADANDIVSNLNSSDVPLEDDDEDMEKISNITSERDILSSVLAANIPIMVPCTLLNGVIVSYYWSRSNNIASILYRRNSICDLMATLGFLLQAPVIIQVLKEETGTIWLPLTSYWITTVSVRMSVFMNCVLGVVRCINIVSPFYQVSSKYVTISTIVYFLLWAVVALLDVSVFLSKTGFYNVLFLIKTVILKAEPGFFFTSKTKTNDSTTSLLSMSQGELIAYQFLVPMLIPAVMCFFLMLYQIYSLMKSRVTFQSENVTRNKKAAVTILIVTMIFVLVSFISATTWLVVYRTHLNSDTPKRLSWTELGIVYKSSSTVFLLGSTATALTLVSRSSGIRKYFSSIFKNVKGCYCKTPVGATPELSKRTNLTGVVKRKD